MDGDLCSSLGNPFLCSNYQNCAITPNILFRLGRVIYNNLNNIFNGVNDFLNNNIQTLSFRFILFEHLPWMFVSLIIIITLASISIINLSMTIMLIIIVLIIGLFASLVTYSDVKSTLKSITNQVTQMILTNLNNNKANIQRQLESEIIIGFGESRVPCPTPSS